MAFTGVANERPLNLALHSPDMTLSGDLASYVRDKLTVKLGKFGRRVTDVVVHFKDTNGDRGGIDKGCHMEARLARLEPVNVDERHEDIRAAIDLCAERLAQAVSSHLQRARTIRRAGGRRARDQKTTA